MAQHCLPFGERCVNIWGQILNQKLAVRKRKSTFTNFFPKIREQCLTKIRRGHKIAHRLLKNCSASFHN